MSIHTFYFPDRGFNNNTDYNTVFDYGDIFVDTMEQCFYVDSIHSEEERFCGCVSLGDIMTLHDYLLAVKGTYDICLQKYAPSSLKSFFKNNVNYTKHPKNDVYSQTYENKPYKVYCNIDDNVFCAIIWGAYFYSCLKAAGSDEDKKISELLKNFILEQISFPEEGYEEIHVLAYLFRKYFEPTRKKVVQSKNSNPSPTKPSIEDLLAENEQLKKRIAASVTVEKFESVKKENSELLQEMAQMKETISELKKQLSDKENKCGKLPEDEDEEDPKKLCRRLSIAYILQLCKFNPKVKPTNSRALSRSLYKICGVTRASVMNYLNDPVLKLNHHKDALNALNKDLRDAGLPELSTRLECE